MAGELGILALDMATSTGWALKDREGTITSGVQRFDLQRGESPGMRFLRFRRWLREVLQRPGTAALTTVTRAADVIAYERAHHRGGAATALCVGMATVMLEEAAANGIEVAPVATTTLKKHATGKGNAGKPEMMAAASKRWASVYPSGVDNDDQADALCVLAWAMETMA